MKKIILTALLMCTLLMQPLMLSGCSKDNGTSSDTAPAVQSGETSAAENEAADESYTADYLPDADYNGADFQIVGHEYPNLFSIVTLADAEEQNGDILNDAMYTRNSEIEEKYNINFKVNYVTGSKG